MQIGTCVYYFWTTTPEGMRVIWEWYSMSCFS